MRINRQTYEEYFLLYADGELNDAQKLEVEEFVDQNPDLGEELEMIAQTVMIPDETIVFADKEILFRKEGSRKVVPMVWMKFVAAAAVLLVLMGAGWIFLKDDVRKPTPVAVVGKENEKEKEKENLEQQAKEIFKANTTKSLVEKEPVVVEKQLVNPKAVTNKHASTGIIDKSKAAPAEVQPEANNEEPVLEHTVPEYVLPDNDVAFNEPSTDPIDIQVQPRKMADDDLATNNNNVHYAQALAEEQEKGDQIYFANTQLPKKTKLRGVLRKASRYLERVTSIQ